MPRRPAVLRKGQEIKERETKGKDDDGFMTGGHHHASQELLLEVPVV